MTLTEEITQTLGKWLLEGDAVTDVSVWLHVCIWSGNEDASFALGQLDKAVDLFNKWDKESEDARLWLVADQIEDQDFRDWHEDCLLSSNTEKDNQS